MKNKIIVLLLISVLSTSCKKEKEIIFNALIQEKNGQIFEHNDSDVDIAILNCLPNQQIFDFQFLPDDMIAHQEIINSHQIAE